MAAGSDPDPARPTESSASGRDPGARHHGQDVAAQAAQVRAHHRHRRRRWRRRRRRPSRPGRGRRPRPTRRAGRPPPPCRAGRDAGRRGRAGGSWVRNMPRPPVAGAGRAAVVPRARLHGIRTDRVARCVAGVSHGCGSSAASVISVHGAQRRRRWPRPSRRKRPAAHSKKAQKAQKARTKAAKKVSAGARAEHGRQGQAAATRSSPFPKERKEPLTDARHVRNALARFDQVEGVTDKERDQAWRRIMTAAKQVRRRGP